MFLAYICQRMKFLPHIITSGNLFCGVLALVLIAEDALIAATWCIFIAGFLDFLDGFVARMLKVSGEFGKQLDSLADVVTFGVVPGFLLFRISDHLNKWPFDMHAPVWVVYVPLLIAVFSALRLAKFNLDMRQSNGFIGVPTPANAFWLAGLPYLIEDHQDWLQKGFITPWVLAGIAVLSCLLLVSELSLLSFKVKSFAFSRAWPQYLLLTSVVFSLIVFKFAGLVALLPLYLFFSLIDKKLNTNEIPG
ncbi:MAG: CDP-diacylglycerol--serine O-phosphatidyltransferase [Bacteroidetes bacterium]|nr:CDP-diacylglycerol--serine O-phosphatidyltransferase [Bacteroidota bacterium]